MRSRRRSAVAVALVLAGLLGLEAQASARPEAKARPREAARVAYRDACGPAAPVHARCFARFAEGPAATLAAASAPAARTHAAAPAQAAPAPDPALAPGGAYGPAELRSAYKLPSATAGAGRTVAVVAAYDHPRAEQDLARYRAHFGMAPCTTANGCFRKLNQDGGSTPPRPDVDWAQEISLDLDMVSAVCPRCRILLVEADSSHLADLTRAVRRALASGADAVSNSWGVPESPAVAPYNSAFAAPGRAITVASGDSGYGLFFPASSQYVTAVGGTRLTRSSGPRGWSESAWSGSGSGCSRLFPKPSWQADRGCARRTVADVSAVADPGTGVAVYHTYGVGGGPWFRAGGTSAAAPLVAGAYALAGSSVRDGSAPYAHGGSLYDVVSGSNGACGGGYLCTAVRGYDGPTGLGTPNGAGAFRAPRAVRREPIDA